MPLNSADCCTQCAVSPDPDNEIPPVERHRGTVLQTIPQRSRSLARKKGALASRSRLTIARPKNRAISDTRKFALMIRLQAIPVFIIRDGSIAIQTLGDFRSAVSVSRS
jgi:hypothetical protein